MGGQQAHGNSLTGFVYPADIRKAIYTIRCAAAFFMSFPRHGEIFRSDVGSSNAGSRSCGLPLALIGLDEFPVGYSFAGCSSAAPASASPTGGAVCSKLVLLVEEFSSNGKVHRHD
jgi:hypothetical protein